MVSWFIARRYLASRFITFASFLLISLSVAILMILLAVMEGFKNEMIERIRGTSSDVRVEGTRFVSLDEHLRVRELAAGVAGVRGSVPYVETLVVYRLSLPRLLGDQTGNLHLEALDLREESRLGQLDDYIRNHTDQYPTRRVPRTIAGTLDRRWIEETMWTEHLGMAPPPDKAELRPIILGEEVFRRPPLHGNLLGVRLELTTISPVTNQPCSAKFVVAGYFKSRDVFQDTQTVLMDLADAIDFMKLTHAETGATSVSGVRLFLEPRADVETVKAAVAGAVREAQIPFARVRTWMEIKAHILRAVRMEKALVGFILGVVVAFVGLTIFIILTVQIVEKTRDLGVLQAIGLLPRGIVAIYLRIGAAICTAGIGFGALYGWGFCYFLGTIQRWIFVLTGWEVFPKSVYYIDEIPVRLVLSDFLFVIVPTVLFSFLASLFASMRAARKRPLEALRYE